MWFNRTNQQNEHPAPVGLSDGIEEKVAEFVKDWGALQRGRRSAVTDSQEPPLQLLTDADVAHFLQAMEDEAKRITDEMDAEIAEQKRRHLAEIAQKDAQIAAINRQIEAQKASNAAQFQEIDRRAHAYADAVMTAEKIDPGFNSSNLFSAGDVRREVVRRKFGDQAVNGRSEAYIDERFESLEARANVDPFALVVANGLKSTAQDGRDTAEKAYLEMCRTLNDGWKTH